MPNDDITHPIPVFGFIAEGQIVLSEIIPVHLSPINILPSSRLMKDGIGEGYTNGSSGCCNQLFSSYSKVRVRSFQIIGRRPYRNR